MSLRAGFVEPEKSSLAAGKTSDRLENENLTAIFPACSPWKRAERDGSTTVIVVDCGG